MPVSPSPSTSSHVAAVRAALEPLRDRERAIAMAAYMKDRFLFLGIPAPARRAAIKPLAKPAPATVPAIARALWKRKEREYHYVAVDLLAATVKKLDAAATLALIEELALVHSWWDTVDGLSGVSAAILRDNPALRAIVWRWSAHDVFWINRLAILHQLGSGEHTDADVLFKLCLRHARNPEFFVRKAIGWALRDYAWSRPDDVRAFVAAHRSTLSALSMREALKNIGA